jgi:cobyrinic acid a,c-diamide synthase
VRSLSLPRVMIAGLAGDAGKTLVTAGLIRALRGRGRKVAPFKKGPDFIDPAWLSCAAGRPARSLDTFLMPPDAILASLASARDADLAIIEGNRGLFDGRDADGTHSSAELAKQIQTPLILVVDVSKCTRTVAALVLGCLALDPGLPLGGVILNRVGTSRQEQVIRGALAKATKVPVLGAIPRLSMDHLPSRHLGLVMPHERQDCEGTLDEIGRILESHADVEAVYCLAAGASPLNLAPDDEPRGCLRSTSRPRRQVVGTASLPSPQRGRGAGVRVCLFTSPCPLPEGEGECALRSLPDSPSPRFTLRHPIRVGVLRDKAFSFYYPENLAALEQQGATLVFISPLADTALPAIDALYAGGGYPEQWAGQLAANAGLRTALAARIAAGLPVWAECGGLMYLAEALVTQGQRHAMVGALPIVVEQTERPQAHGYVESYVDTENPFLSCGTLLRGHEFHTSRICSGSAGIKTALSVRSGKGIGHARDGIIADRVFASYLHLLAPGVPEWAPAFVRVARQVRA